MNFLKKLFHRHIWTLPGKELKCEECGFIPTCPKHGTTLYVHGWYDDVDCLECQKENKL